ncbi:MAG: sulfatase-like hydrolase/transferase [Desulfobacteraceae bacterium]
MNNRTILKTLIGFLVTGVLLIGASCRKSEKEQEATQESQADRKPPNILLIIGDDIGIDTTSNMYPGLIDNLTKKYGPSGHNHPKYKDIHGRPASTPVLDNLAKGGMRFTQTWTQPFCSPTRTSLLTGLFSAKTGVLDYIDWLSQNHHSFVQDLKDKGGYSTAIFGKWHMAGLGQNPEYPGMKPKEAGFDLFQGNLHGGLATYFKYDYHVQDDTTPPDQWRTEKEPTRSLPGIAPTTFAPVVKTSDAINWITEQETKNPDKPWFAWFAFNLSHITGNFKPNPMVIPNADTMDEVSRKEMEECMGPDGQFGSANVGSCSSEALMRAMTNTMDTMIGRLVETVDKLDPNTYIIYLGDNGTWMLGPGVNFIDNMYITKEGRSKGTAYESGVHVSMAIRGPGIKPGSRSDEWIHDVDLFPTVLQMAGLEVPETVPNRAGAMVDVDGVSLTPILFDGAKGLRDPEKGYLLAETVNPVKGNLMQVAARNATYKVLCENNAETGSCIFYNLADDPIEEYPLARPDSCENYKNGTWNPDNPEWNFCYLQEIIAKKSFLADPEKIKAAPFAKMGPPPEQPENN